MTDPAITKNPKPVIIFDVDGTIALRGDRDPYDMTRVGEDLPNEPVLRVARLIAASNKVDIIFVSGRDGSARLQTQAWLDHHFVYNYHLYTRATGDNRPDDQVKRDVLNWIRTFRSDIVCVFDDRNRVVDMWRDEGVTCFQVCSREQGDF